MSIKRTIWNDEYESYCWFKKQVKVVKDEHYIWYATHLRDSLQTLETIAYTEKG